MRHAVIMAGGVGERFWPLSRRKTPKQLLSIVGKTTMIEETVGRLAPLIPAERIWIITNQLQAGIIRKLLENIPASQVIAEPVGRNTAPCIALAAYLISRKDPDATMIVLPADHVISPKKGFHRTIRNCCRTAEARSALVTIGIRPTYPATGYGYIKKGRKICGYRGQEFYTVDRFVEKPDRPTAVRYCENGGYAWNSGMFVWTAETIISAFEEHLPDIGKALSSARELGQGKLTKFLSQTYPSLPSISIDYGIMEKATTVLVTDATFKWDDVGSWESLQNYLPVDRRGNRGRGEVIVCDSDNCIGFSDGRLIGMVGVSDLIVVSAEDAVLVCNRHRAQDVKKLVQKLSEKKDFEKYL